MKRLTLSLLIVSVAAAIQAAPPVEMTPDSGVIDSVIIALKGERDYDYAWSAILARGTGTYQEPPYGPVGIEWVIYTNSDGYVQFVFNFPICPRYLPVVEGRKDILGRNWEVMIYPRATWIGVDNCWLGDFADAGHVYRRNLAVAYVAKLATLEFIKKLEVEKVFE